MSNYGPARRNAELRIHRQVMYGRGPGRDGYIRRYGEEKGAAEYEADLERLAEIIRSKGHRINSRIAAWTFGHKPGTRSIDLVCGEPIVYVLGPKRHYWRHA